MTRSREKRPSGLFLASATATVIMCLRVSLAEAPRKVTLLRPSNTDAIAEVTDSAKAEGLQGFRVEPARTYDIQFDGRTIGTLVSATAEAAEPNGAFRQVCIVGSVTLRTPARDLVLLEKGMTKDPAGCRGIDAVGVVESAPVVRIAVFSHGYGATGDQPSIFKLDDFIYYDASYTSIVRHSHVTDVVSLRRHLDAYAAEEAEGARRAQEEARAAELAELAGWKKGVDSQMRRAALMLSPPGRSTLQQIFEARRTYIAGVCPTRADVLTCQIVEWRNFEGELHQAGVRVGPFIFGMRQNLTFRKVGGDTSGKDAEFVLMRSVVPFIDNAVGVDSKIVTAWNATISRAYAQTGTSCENGADVTGDYTIEGATPRVISVLFAYGEYCSGTPHGHGSLAGSNLLLTTAPQAIALSDLFKPTSDWAATLRCLSVDALKIPDRFGRIYSPENVKIILGRGATSFSIRGHALHLVYDTGVPSLGAPQVDIPWSKLRPYLRSDAPIP